MGVAKSPIVAGIMIRAWQRLINDIGVDGKYNDEKN